MILEKFVVLVVEDEALIRMEALRMVEDAGFLSAEAANADEAMQILERRKDIGAVFTDINMCGSMDGLQLSHAIRERWPPIHLIVTSGLAPVGREMPENTHFLGKPYGAEHIAALLGEMLPADHVPLGLDRDIRGSRGKLV